MSVSLDRLYSFRRCPYAMRARLGIVFAELSVELREIELKNKPAPMLAISPKGTVPVLQLSASDGTSGRVLEESQDILMWALERHDPQGLLDTDLSRAQALIQHNDDEFKYWLDRYKYADRHPQQTQLEYRQQGEVFLQQLEQLLTEHSYLLGDRISVADIAIMPFVRQFAHVDREVFFSLPYPYLQQWLTRWLEHPAFIQVMYKFKPWQEGDERVVFPLETH
ncbi:MAG: glutathione S-transferase [Gammaproteobacteria bacterium]|nr:glutathione S-transferase [Gammaproteobacteria bacterium]